MTVPCDGRYAAKTSPRANSTDVPEPTPPIINDLMALILGKSRTADMVEDGEDALGGVAMVDAVVCLRVEEWSEKE